MKNVYKVLADIVFLSHFVFGAMILVGWIFPSVKYFYLALLLSWPVSWIIFRHCILTKWEFLLRKKYDPSINANEEFITHYVHRFFKIDLSSKTVMADGLLVFFVLLVLYFVRNFIV